MNEIAWLVLMVVMSGCATGGLAGMPDAEMREITVDGVKLAYEEFGSGRPVVFLHGLGANSASWRAVAQDLAATHRTICLDLMGFGHSQKPRDEEYTLDRQAELVRGFIGGLDLDSPLLVGQSYGGGICLMVQQQLGPSQGEVLGGLILVDSVCYPQRLPGYVKQLRMPVLRAVGLRVVPARVNVRRIEKKLYYKDERIPPDLVRAYAGNMRSKGGRKALVETADNMIPPNLDELTASYGYISVPTLVIWGRHDEVIPVELGERLTVEIPSAEFVVIEDCGHNPQEEKPAETAARIRSFLDSPGGAT